MTDNPQPITDQELGVYLDGLLSTEERKAFEQRLRSQPELLREIQQLEEIEHSVRRLFPPEQLPETQVASLIEYLGQAKGTTTPLAAGHSSKNALGIALIGLAATLAWVMVVWQWKKETIESPYFELRPVAEVYQEVLDSGFEPYYECRDDKRFSDTFLRRQGQALRLATLPQGSHMLGLSYAGGLSRETTAMLCRVDGEPVMVFVDQLEKDSPRALQHQAGQTKVHRVARDGLVFYEVTPFDSARVIEHLIAR